MPKIIGTVGTGMTHEGFVSFDWDEPGDVEAQIDAAVETWSRSNFSLLSRRLAELATAILNQAGLPSDPGKFYEMTPEGGWVVVDEGAALEPATSGVYQPLHAVVEESGYAHDSPEGYAAAVLRHLFAARVYLRAGHHDEAMASAFALGELVNEAGMKEIFEQDVDVGERVRAGGRRAHIETYGTENEIQARYAAYAATIERFVAQGSGRMDAYRAAAKAHGVSETTVRRAVARLNSTR